MNLGECSGKILIGVMVNVILCKVVDGKEENR